MKYFKTTETATVNNYPYGSMKATATFSLEFKAGKGFRTVFQSVNPKTGRINAPKKSTYYAIMAMYQNEETGHIKYSGFDMNGEKEFNAACKFLADHFDLFTPEQIKEIYIHAAMMVKVEIQALVTYTGADSGKTITLLEPVLKLALQGMKEGTNVFSQLHMDEAAIQELRVPNYNPFVVTSSFTIGANSMQAN